MARWLAQPVGGLTCTGNIEEMHLLFYLAISRDLSRPLLSVCVDSMFQVEKSTRKVIPVGALSCVLYSYSYMAGTSTTFVVRTPW